MASDQYILLSGPIFAWLYFATVISTAFYGFTCMQTFFYYVHYRNDPLRFKIFVAVIWALNTIHEALTVTGTYKYVAASLANPELLFDWFPELSLQALATCLVAILTQGLLMYRIYVLSGKRIIALFVWFVLGVLQLVFTTLYIAKALYSANGSVYDVNIVELNDSTFKTILTLCFSISSGEDILIAIVLVFLFVRQRPATLIPSTAHVLQRLTVFAVNTGTWTATFALLSVVFMYVLPSKGIYALFAFPICSIYCNTVLATLNARVYLKDSSKVHYSSVDFATNETPARGRQPGEAKLVFAPRVAAARTTGPVKFSDVSPESMISDDVIELDRI